MKRHVLLGGVLAVTAALVVLEEVGEAQKGNPFQYGWFGNLAQARQQARQSGKPLMVVFRCEP